MSGFAKLMSPKWRIVDCYTTAWSPPICRMGSAKLCKAISGAADLKTYATEGLQPVEQQSIICPTGFKAY